MPGLIVLVNQHPQEAKKEYEARECSSDGLADKHRKKSALRPSSLTTRIPRSFLPGVVPLVQRNKAQATYTRKANETTCRNVESDVLRCADESDPIHK